MHYLVLLAFAIGIAGWVFLAISRLRPPLVQAAHIELPSTSATNAYCYLWLDDHTLLLYEEQSNPTSQGKASTFSLSQPPPVRSLDVIDTQSHARRSLACPSVPPPPVSIATCNYHLTLQFALSPDTRNLLALSDFGYSVIPVSSVEQRQHTFDLAWNPWPGVKPGQHGTILNLGCASVYPLQYHGDQIKVISDDSQYATWLSSGTWSTMSYKDGRLTCRTAGKNGAEPVSRAFSSVAEASQDKFEMRAVGADSHGHMIVLSSPNDPGVMTGPYHLLELDPASSRKISDETAQIPLYQGSPQVTDAAVSPQGDRIAWLLPREPQSPTPLQSWLIRFHLISPAPSPDTALWVSDRYGRHMHLVKEWVNGSDEISSLQWRPDGNAVSFEEITESTTQTKIDLKIDTVAVGH